MKFSRFAFSFLLLVFFLACSTSKNIPEGKYLLDNVTIDHDTHNATSDLELFLRQHPNGGLGKVRLRIYNSAGQDTTKWFTRFIRNIGEAPVLYSKSRVKTSMEQLQKEAINQGYLDAIVDTSTQIKGNKIAVKYNLKGGTPYRIRKYEYALQDSGMARIMNLIPLQPALVPGELYDMEMLEQERIRISNIMRNVGYFNFSKELAYFKADTTLNSHEVDLFLNVYPAYDGRPYHRMKFNKITIISGIDGREATNIVQGLSNERKGRRRQQYVRNADTTEYKNTTIIRPRNNFLRNSSIDKNLFIRQGRYYSDRALSGTYEAFNKMGAVKQVSITTKPSMEDSLHLIDATILLTPADAHGFRAGLEGTNSAGDIGIAPSLSYSHRNLFNGSEQLTVNLKGAYEFITGDKAGDLLNQNYYEYGAETSLSFPQFLFPWMKKSWREMPSAMTVFSVGLNKQHRREYTRDFFNFTLNYNWRSNQNRFTHGVDLFDVNYIRMSSISQAFDSIYLSNPKNPLLRESYKDQLISRMSYTFSMVNPYRFNSMSPTYSFRASVEVAGLLPKLATIGSSAKDSQGQKTILNVAYAEYVKAEFDYSRTYYLSKKHSIALHGHLGIAQPYGNSGILPFERRFFSGGANSVRGWSTRRLGPGSYRGGDTNTDFVNQVGDFKLEFNIENRHKVAGYLELAEFIDVGNIWTLKNYESQVGGQFKLDKFYKELAVAYGVGLRLDLSFLLLRLDWGLRAYDPAKESRKFVVLKPRASRMAFHFGIGYPF